MKVWIIYGGTESGDEIGPYIVDYSPTEIEAHEIIKKDWPGEYYDYAGNPCVPETYNESTINLKIAVSDVMTK